MFFRGSELGVELSLWSVDIVELEVDGAFEAYTWDVRPVEEAVGCRREREERESGGEEEEGGEIRAQSGARDKWINGLEEGRL